MEWDYFFFNGGGTEIRTLGTLRHGSFQDCCNQPLCHPSVEMWGEYIEESLFVKIIFEKYLKYLELHRQSIFFLLTYISVSSLRKNIFFLEFLVFEIFLDQLITDLCPSISIMELEHLIWDDHSFGFSEFLVGTESTREEEVADESIDRSTGFSKLSK